MDFLNKLPDLAVFAAVTLPFMIGVVAASYLGGRFRRKRPPEASSFEIMDAFIAVASAAAVVLAFTLVQVDSTLKQTDDIAVKEAGAVNALDRALFRMKVPQLEATRQPLMIYAQTIVKEEWPLLADGDRSEKVDGLYRTISGALRAWEPSTPREQALFNEALRAIDQMGEYREARISASASGLSALFWRAIAAIFCLLVLIAFNADPTPRRISSMVAIAGTLGILLALVVILDSPFVGDATLEPEALQRVMDTMLTRK
jgi:hypothetical protein